MDKRKQKQTIKHIEKRANSLSKTLKERRKDKEYDKKFREKCGKANAKYLKKLSKEELIELYLEQKLSMTQIAKSIRADVCTIKNWLKKYGIRVRPLAESQKLRKMPKIFNKTFETLKKNTRTGSYFNHIRPLILKRDNFKCGNCGAIDYICVHHIIPLEKGGTHDAENLITLCRKCHRRRHQELESK